MSHRYHCPAVTLQERVQLGDLIGILWEASEAYRAIEHGRSGVQQGVDPAQEAQRIVDAFAALQEVATKVLPPLAQTTRP